jgi:tRNA uridine 5-carboxymethylaminomethyl modification enzyme
MFTSRAEYRLAHRADNADDRLTPLGLELGCVGPERAAAFRARADALEAAKALARSLTLTPTEAAKRGLQVNRDGRIRSAFDVLAHPSVHIETLAGIWPELGALDPVTAERLETEAKYAVYLARQETDIARLRREEHLFIPADLDLDVIPGLSNELKHKLRLVRPETVAQASRIDGMTPAALTLLVAQAKRRRSAA